MEIFFSLTIGKFDTKNRNYGYVYVYDLTIGSTYSESHGCRLGESVSKNYKEYLDLWQERVEGGTIDEEKKPKNLRDRISKDELCKPKSYKSKLTDLEEHLTSIL